MVDWHGNYRRLVCGICLKVLLLLGAINGALAVALGAFGAHALKSRLDEGALAVWATASQYHFYHALALLLAGLLARQFSAAGLVYAGMALALGMVLFCGSLYLLALTGQRWLGAVTPLGGVALITGWVWLAIVLQRQL